jgi:hypothetical protein
MAGAFATWLANVARQAVRRHGREAESPSTSGPKPLIIWWKKDAKSIEAA